MNDSMNRQRGLTLIELVVVLTILVALGGIAAATLPNMLNRTHVATVATSLPTIDATIRQNVMLNSGQVGNRFDSLVTASGQPASFVNASGAYASYALAGNDASALNDLGISQLIPADDSATAGGENATFLGHRGTAANVATGTNVCTLTLGASGSAPGILNDVWNYTPQTGAQYIVLGLGEQCSLVGANEGAFFSEAPLHAVDAHSERADNAYARILVVIELTDAGTANSEARYIGVGAPHPDGVQGVATHLQEWYGS
ncbi:MAG: type II secretion system protein [Planctomycetota bacterium]